MLLSLARWLEKSFFSFLKIWKARLVFSFYSFKCYIKRRFKKWFWEVESVRTYSKNKCYVFFPTEGYGGNLNDEKNEKE